MSIDIKTAFDRIKHKSLYEANRSLTIPLLAQLACMLDYVCKTATFSLPGNHTTSPLPFESGGWQGGVNTPDEFNSLLEYILGPIIQQWKEDGIRFYMDGQETPHIVWADSLIFIVHNIQQM